MITHELDPLETETLRYLWTPDLDPLFWRPDRIGVEWWSAGVGSVKVTDVARSALVLKERLVSARKAQSPKATSPAEAVTSKSDSHPTR